MQDTEIHLVQKAAQGDAEAFTDFFDRYYQQVYNFALWLCNDEHMAEDLTQDTFIKAHKNLHRLGPPWNVRSWLYRLARNTHVDQHRRQPKAQALDPEAPIASPVLDPERAVLQDELSDLVRRAFQRLTPNYREALILRDIEGFHYAEIAEIMGVSLDGIKVLIHRARLSFKDHYGLRLLTEEPLPQCAVLNELLDMSHDREALEEQEKLVRAHVKDCQSCQQRKRELATLGSLLVSLPRATPPARLRERVLRRAARPRVPMRARVAGAVLVAGFLIAVLILLLGPSGRDGSQDDLQTPAETEPGIIPFIRTPDGTLTRSPLDGPAPTVVTPGAGIVPPDSPAGIATNSPASEPPPDGSDGSLCGDGICQPGESPDWCGDCVSSGGGGGGTGGTGGGASPPPPPAAICGNGILEPGEQCETNSDCVGNPAGSHCVGVCECGEG